METRDEARALRDLTFSALSEANRKRTTECFHPIEEWSPTDWACALAGEVGEACNLIKKWRRGEEIDLADVGSELADVVIYADLFCARIGLVLEEVIRHKFNQTSDKIGSDVTL